MQLLGGCRQALRAAYADFLTGSPPRQPAALVLTPSALDDSVAPAGAHMVTVWGQWYPYRLAGGRDWSELRQSATDALLEQVERAAPGFRETIDHVYVQTPVDLATELALEQGDVMHVEMELDGLFGLRPLPEWSSYRGPRRGLYLTGASTHPGGGVFGASGRTAAHVVLADQRHARRWRWR
jgi:phytoene dehydrogenase-like protein